MSRGGTGNEAGLACAACGDRHRLCRSQLGVGLQELGLGEDRRGKLLGVVVVIPGVFSLLDGICRCRRQNKLEDVSITNRIEDLRLVVEIYDTKGSQISGLDKGGRLVTISPTFSRTNTSLPLRQSGARSEDILPSRSGRNLSTQASATDALSVSTVDHGQHSTQSNSSVGSTTLQHNKPTQLRQDGSPRTQHDPHLSRRAIGMSRSTDCADEDGRSVCDESVAWRLFHRLKRGVSRRGAEVDGASVSTVTRPPKIGLEPNWYKMG